MFTLLETLNYTFSHKDTASWTSHGITFSTTEASEDDDDGEPYIYTVVSRLLGSPDKYENGEHRVDFSVLSYGVLTLGILLVVEYIRHRLDHAAKHRPFFKTVLEGAYTELATLGIVEFFVHVFVSYYKGYDKVKKEVFTEVHFVLFYTAILNAFQSCFLSFVSRRASRKMWVEPEMLDVNHYVDIREEFEVVQQQLCKLKYGRHWRTYCGKFENSKDCRAVDVDVTNTMESENEESMNLEENHLSDHPHRSTSLKYDNTQHCNRKNTAFTNTGGEDSWLSVITDRMRYPRLKNKYNKLLFQIRFHESKVLFLQSFRNLPLKLRISDYLGRCELHVLQKLVHVRAVAWILLTITANLLYYILGVLTYMTGDTVLVGQALIVVFFLVLVAFIGMAYLTHRKMKGIFRLMMKDKDLWISHDGDQDKDVKGRLLEKQLKMFWWSNPTIVISIIQFMQFGYALALSVLIEFWEEIAAGGVPMHHFVLAIFVCYFVFLATIGQVIPQYTMCTSLAQMMNVQLLHETLAAFRLDEAKRKETAKHVDKLMLLPSKQNEQHHAQHIPGKGKNGTDGPSGMMICDVVNNDNDAAKQRQYNLANAGADDEYELMLLSLQKMHATDSQVDKVLFNYEYKNSSNSRSKEPATEAYNSAKSSVIVKDRTRQAQPDTADSEPNADKNEGTDKDGKGATDTTILMGTLVRMDTQELRSILNETHQRQIIITGSEESEEENFPHLLSKPNRTPTSSLPKYDRNLSSAHAKASAVSVTSASETKVHSSGLVLSLRKHLRRYFMSRKYILLSNLCGTTLAFFMLAKRVEIFVHSERIVSSEFLSYQFYPSDTFWLITMWFVAFIIESLLIFCSMFPIKKLSRMGEKKVVIAALLDLVLISICLILFLFAEKQRCCETPVNVLVQHRYLAATESEEHKKGEEDYNTDTTIKSKDDDVHPDGSICNCPLFGTRLYGGLGMFEPFVSLMALRLLRHYVAKRLLEYYDNMNRKSSEDNDVIQNHRDGGNPFAVSDDHSHGHGNRHANPFLVGTAVSLWEATVLKHPELVNEFGEFSEQILRVMLGVSLLDESKPKSLSPQISSIPGSAPTVASESEMKISKSASECTPMKNIEQVTFVSRSQPVRDRESVENNLLDGNKVNWTQPIMESVDNMEMGYLHDDMNQRDQSIDYHVGYPDALLLRTMRRCDRKVLPILDQWSVVDVVITSHEIVYFDATDVDSLPEHQPLQDCMELLKSTKGGKNLRLRDVAVGRRVVGHLDLSDIHSVHVHRQLHGSSSIPSRNGLEILAEAAEFWKRKQGQMVITSHAERRASQYWDELNQDILTIKTAHGRTFALRFYSDLKEVVQHPDRIGGENDDCGNLFKTHALLWAQTIVRLCGREQLHRQHLPHHFDGTPDELRDYLISHYDRTGHRRGFNMHSFASSDHGENLFYGERRFL